MKNLPTHLDERLKAILRKNSPTLSDVYVSATLTGMSVGYQQAAEDFLVNRLNAFVDVPEPTGQFFKHTKDDWFRSTAQKRAPGAPTAGGDYALTTATYATNIWGIHKDTPSPVIRAAANILKIDENAMRYCMNQMLLGMDVDLVDNVLKASVWNTSDGGDWSGGAADNGYVVTFWNRDGSKPIRDVRKVIKRIRTRTGKRANTVIMGPEVLSALLDNADVISRFPGNADILVDEAALARHFQVKRVFVFDTSKNTANKGAAAVMADAFGKHMWVGYLDPNPGIDTATAFATHRWAGPSALYGNVDGMQVKRFELVKEDSIRVEAQAAWHHNIVASDAGEFFSAIVE